MVSGGLYAGQVMVYDYSSLFKKYYISEVCLQQNSSLYIYIFNGFQKYFHWYPLLLHGILVSSERQRETFLMVWQQHFCLTYFVLSSNFIYTSVFVKTGKTRLHNTVIPIHSAKNPI